MSKVINLTKDTFNSEVIESSLPVLVDFWAPWCQPCVMMAPILEELADSYDGKLKVAKLDIENPENQAYAMLYDIMSIPNMKLFQNGKVVEEIIGLHSKQQMKEILQRHLE
jgi:thioredoxin 1